jgi:hypothetical protein
MSPWEKYAAQPAPATDSAPQGPWSKYGGEQAPAQPEQSMLGFTGSSLSKGVANILGTPMDIAAAGGAGINTLANKILGTHLQQSGVTPGGSEWMQQKFKQAGFITPSAEPRSTTQKYVAAGLEAAPSAVLPFGGVGKVARTVGAVGSGLGSEAGRQVGGEKGQLLGSVLGGMPGQLAGMGAAVAAGKAAQAGGKALSKAAINRLPNLDPETAQLARDAHAMGFRLRPDQVYQSKLGSMAGEFASQVPFAGAKQEANQLTFNRNIVKTIGGEGDKLTRQVYAGAMKKSGGEIGDIAARTPLPINEDVVNRLTSHVAEAQKFDTPDVARAVSSYVNMISDMAPSGTLPGEAFRKINTKIGNQIRTTANGDLKRALSDLQEDFLDARGAYLTAADKKAYDVARRQYAAGKAIEGLVAKSPTGNIPPSALLGAITATKAGKSLAARGAAGDLGKLADIGQRFLKEPASSGTAERALIQRGLIGLAGAGGGTALMGASAAPAAAALYSGARAYNKLGPSVTEQLLARPPRP